MIARLPLPPAPAVLALIVCAFVFPGLAQHDPWKPFDALGVEIVHQMHVSGDWLVPQLAGVSWLEDPPLYHWMALVPAKLAGGLIEFHNAVRLASGACVLASAWLLYRAGGTLAPLVLVGCTGLMVHAHEAMPDLASLAFVCAALLVLLRSPTRPLSNGALFGLALAGAFLSTGFTNALALYAAALIAHAASPQLRTRAALPFLGAALAVAVAVSAAWPLALWLRSPALLDAWWQTGVRASGEPPANLRYFLGVAVWFAWPAWPLAVWTLWSSRRRLQAPELAIPLAVAATLAVGIVLAGPAQDNNALTLLAPLSLLAVHAVPQLRRGAANALDWFGVMTFAFFAGLVWLGWFAMMTGLPPRVANNFAKTAPGFAPEFSVFALLAALLLTLAWGALAFLTAPSAARSVTRWAAGIALLWGLFSTLWMPWADYQKSYRSTSLDLRGYLPASSSCIWQRNLGLPQGAALSYHAGLRTKPFDPATPSACDVLLVQGHPRQESDVPGSAWRLLGETGRPGDKNERFRLYKLER